jgi:hypothetical protein
MDKRFGLFLERVEDFSRPPDRIRPVDLLEAIDFTTRTEMVIYLQGEVKSHFRPPRG